MEKISSTFDNNNTMASCFSTMPASLHPGPPQDGSFVQATQPSSVQHVGFGDDVISSTSRGGSWMGSDLQRSCARSRRERTRFLPYQKAQMEATFAITEHPDFEGRSMLAQQLGLKETVIQIWFKNRRSKRRKKDNNDKSSNDKPPASSAGPVPNCSSSMPSHKTFTAPPLPSQASLQPPFNWTLNRASSPSYTNKTPLDAHPQPGSGFTYYPSPSLLQYPPAPMTQQYHNNCSTLYTSTPNQLFQATAHSALNPTITVSSHQNRPFLSPFCQSTVASSAGLTNASNASLSDMSSGSDLLERANYNLLSSIHTSSISPTLLDRQSQHLNPSTSALHVLMPSTAVTMSSLQPSPLVHLSPPFLSPAIGSLAFSTPYKPTSVTGDQNNTSGGYCLLQPPPLLEMSNHSYLQDLMTMSAVNQDESKVGLI